MERYRVHGGYDKGEDLEWEREARWCIDTQTLHMDEMQGKLTEQGDIRWTTADSKRAGTGAWRRVNVSPHQVMMMRRPPPLSMSMLLLTGLAVGFKRTLVFLRSLMRK